jgi:hypothetical protein
MPSKKPAAPKPPATRAAVAKPTSRTAATRTRTRTAEASPIRPLTHDEIARRAHDLYVQSGFQGHREVEFWLEAERQLKDGIKV